LESRSLDIDFINEDQLRTLLAPEPEPIPEPVEIVEETLPEEVGTVVEEEIEEEPVIEEEEEIEEEPVIEEEEEIEEEPVVEEEEEIEEEPVLDEELDIEETPVEEEAEKEVVEVEPVLEEDVDLEIEIQDEGAIEQPGQQIIERDEVYEIETIKSAIPVKKAKPVDIKKKFSSVLKDFSVDLGERSRSIKKKAKQRDKDRQSVKRVKKVKTILTDNQDLFKRRQIVAKWKHFPLSRIMLKEYIPEVNKAIKPYWNLPLEMDPTLEILVKLKISKTGKILDYDFVESSRNRFFNHSVIQVFKNLDQLPPLPEGFMGESTEIGLRFTSKQINNE
jgi:TonB family protein